MGSHRLLKITASRDPGEYWCRRVHAWARRNSFAPFGSARFGLVLACAARISFFLADCLDANLFARACARAAAGMHCPSLPHAEFQTLASGTSGQFGRVV